MDGRKRKGPFLSEIMPLYTGFRTLAELTTSPLGDLFRGVLLKRRDLSHSPGYFFPMKLLPKSFERLRGWCFSIQKDQQVLLFQRIFYMMSEGMFMLLFLKFMNMFFRWVAQPSAGYVSQAGTLEAASLVVKQSIPSKFGWPLVLRHESDSKFWICVFIYLYIYI